MVKAITIDDADKGSPVRFQGGKYAGMNGWLDATQKQPPVKRHVIVDQGNGKGIYTCVDSKSIATPFRKATNQLESAVQQVALIEKQLAALCVTLVKCQIRKVSPELTALLQAKLLEAVVVHENKKTRSQPALRYDIDLWDDDLTNDDLTNDMF